MESSRSSIIDTAQRLFYSRGYESTSVAAIIDSVGIAKGTFYHHFDSKESLLEEMVQEQLAVLEPILTAVADDDTRPALDRLGEFFGTITQWKADNRRLMIEAVRMLYHPDNLRLRHTIQRGYRELFGSLISRIVAQGHAEGSLDCPFAQNAGQVVFDLSQGMGENTARLVLACVDDLGHFDELWETVVVYMTCIERIVGAPEGSLQIIQKGTVRAIVEPNDGGAR